MEDLPLASFSDIAFLLIIFFIIVTQIIKTKGIELDIPAGEKSQSAEKETNTINLDADIITFNGDTLPDVKELQQRLTELDLETAEGNDKVVIVEATESVSYELWFSACSSVLNAGGVVGFVEKSDGDGGEGGEGGGEGGGGEGASL